MKKLYIQPNVHVIKMNPSDIIATSPNGISLTNGDPVEDLNDGNLFNNGYSLGW